MSRRARKAQNATSAPMSSGDEAMTRKSKQKPTVKKGRRWGPEGYAEEDEDVQLDYSAPAGDDEQPSARSTAVEVAPASSWGSTTKGKFVLRDLDDEVHSILASAEAKEAAASSKTGQPSGIVGSGINAMSGLFRSLVGGKVLTKEDLDKAMKGMEDHLLRKNVAREAAIRLCEGVEKELIGVKTGSFEGMLVLYLTEPVLQETRHTHTNALLPEPLL